MQRNIEKVGYFSAACRCYGLGSEAFTLMLLGGFVLGSVLDDLRAKIPCWRFRA